jgi:hypothetical protein
MDNDLAGCIGYVIVLIIFGILALIFAPISCAAKFPGLHTEWGPMKGCLVQTEKGLIPAENYRVM